MRHMIFGESHGPAIGVVVEGVPAGLELDLAAVQKELDRRRPGQGPITTAPPPGRRATWCRCSPGCSRERPPGPPWPW